MSALELPPTTDSVPLARRFARTTLRESSSDVETVLLLVSEVVTNAVLHARSAIRIVIVDGDERVRVEVHDGSPVPPRMHHFQVSSGTGRGLRMLDRLSEAWGVSPVARGSGKVVWFEVGPPDEVVWESFADEFEGVDGDS